MSKLLALKNFIYEELAIPSGSDRRKILINEMANLNDKKIHCFNCSGTCCTFSANSMQITPIEAFEILLSLEMRGINYQELKNILQKNIQEYRLDHEIFLGKKINSYLRKTYSCPFFVTGSKGCTIKKELKPYGCLGFNPRVENDNGGECHSNTEILERRNDSEFQKEDIANSYLKKQLSLDWDKLEIPKAVLAIIERIYCP